MALGSELILGVIAGSDVISYLDVVCVLWARFWLGSAVLLRLQCWLKSVCIVCLRWLDDLF